MNNTLNILTFDSYYFFIFRPMSLSQQHQQKQQLQQQMIEQQQQQQHQMQPADGSGQSFDKPALPPKPPLSPPASQVPSPPAGK